jgi:hypothetical protein
MNLEELIAREEIRQVTALWTDTVIWRNYDMFQSLWTENATWTIGKPFPMQVEGITNIVSKLKELLTLEKAFFQALHEGVIIVDGDRASARWGVTEFGRPDVPDQGYFNHAFYEDQLTKTASGWKFARRDYQYIYVDSSLLNGEWYMPLKDS